MMTSRLTALLPCVVIAAGCTAVSLERDTVSQSESAADYRYCATLHALAMVAADPGTLPTYSLLSNGVASVTCSGMFNPVTTWKASPFLFASEAFSLTATHSPQIQWTVDPVADDSQLEAMRCACRWVLEGPDHLGLDCHHILADPERDTTPGPHFGVADRLTHLPQRWLHAGRLRDVPHGACYKDHCCDTWVWVMPDGMEGLAGFTLVLQDIATLNVAPSDNSLPANRTPPLLATLWVVENTLEPFVVINVQTINNKVTYYRDGGTPGEIVDLTVGQSVVWRNLDDAKTHTATATIVGATLFDTVAIKPHAWSKPVKFDQDLYIKAGGTLGEAVPLTYSSATAGDVSRPGQLSLRGVNSLYSPTLVFRVDRVIRPQCKHLIEERVKEGLANKQADAVSISWNDWMEWTTPFQGQRTSAKPGAATSTPVTVPTRMVPPTTVLNRANAVNSEGFRMGATLRDLIKIQNPFQDPVPPNPPSVAPKDSKP
jgi:hypothetical protein